MDIQQLLNTSAPPANAKKGPKELGQDDFMKLLVAQMKNQDPNNPTDNGQFLAQIAQFSMVNGIDKLGTSFDSVAGSMSSTQAMQAASLVGRQVLTETSTSWMEDGEPLGGVTEIPDYADGLNIQVRDNYGKLVKTLNTQDFKPGEYAFNWDGTNELDEVQEAGEYAITATALVNGKQLALPVQLYNTVESVTLERNNQIQLELDNKTRVNLSNISQYR
ncbi:MAG: flagellar hook assembly protein FlgD [Pseudomonadota bacterium]